MNVSTRKLRIPLRIAAGAVLSVLLPLALHAATSDTVAVNWSKVESISRTTATLQVVVNPLLRRGSTIHDQAFEALKKLGCNYVRYVPWLPYPKLAVAELEPPRDGKTSWDFSLIDPMTEDFMNATAGHSVILNFSTIPEWMFKTPAPVPYPSNPDQVNWHYEQGTALRDPTMKEVVDYYARLVSWYTRGGFRDEYGKRHESGHHYKIPYWEVLNEVDGEHKMSPEYYTQVYDAVVTAIRKVDPKMKFVGLALARTTPAGSLGVDVPKYFEYFLNHKNHRPGVPLDMISYHFYAVPESDQSPDEWPYVFFAQANHFLDVVRYIEVIRRNWSPETKTTIDEIGSILPDDNALPRKPIPNSYWNLSGALYAYVYAQLALYGIDVAGESQLVGYPSQFPSVTMIDWKTGRPNARYWVLKLLHDNFGPGDRLVDTAGPRDPVYARCFVTPSGEHKILLVNRANRQYVISLSGVPKAREEYVDQTTASEGIASAELTAGKVTLNGLAVAVVTVAK